MSFFLLLFSFHTSRWCGVSAIQQVSTHVPTVRAVFSFGCYRFSYAIMSSLFVWYIAVYQPRVSMQVRLFWLMLYLADIQMNKYTEVPDVSCHQPRVRVFLILVSYSCLSFSSDCYCSEAVKHRCDPSHWQLFADYFTFLYWINMFLFIT